MPKGKDESGIKGLSLNGHSYLTTDKGFYLQGFQTVIKDATNRDVYNAEKYGIELVSRYIKIQKELLYLKKIDEKQTLSTTTIIYQVKTGIMINGKLYITVQILDEHHITIMYNYRYRVDSRHFFNAENVFDRRITHKNTAKGSWGHTTAKWIRNRNRQESIRRKYKER